MKNIKLKYVKRLSVIISPTVFEGGSAGLLSNPIFFRSAACADVSPLSGSAFMRCGNFGERILILFILSIRPFC